MKKAGHDPKAILDDLKKTVKSKLRPTDPDTKRRARRFGAAPFALSFPSTHRKTPKMKRSENRILTTHVGSLIRSKAASRPSKSHDQKKLDEEVADIVAHQAKAGIDIVNDGEFGKSGWANYILERLSGFEPRTDKLYEAVWLGRDRIRFAEFMKEQFPRGAAGSPGHACVGPIVYTRL